MNHPFFISSFLSFGVCSSLHWASGCLDSKQIVSQGNMNEHFFHRKNKYCRLQLEKIYFLSFSLHLSDIPTSKTSQCGKNWLFPCLFPCDLTSTNNFNRKKYLIYKTSHHLIGKQPLNKGIYIKSWKKWYFIAVGSSKITEFILKINSGNFFNFDSFFKFFISCTMAQLVALFLCRMRVLASNHNLESFCMECACGDEPGASSFPCFWLFLLFLFLFNKYT